MQIKLSESPVKNRLEIQLSPMSKSQIEKMGSLQQYQLQPQSRHGQRKFNLNELSAKIEVMEGKIKKRDFVSPTQMRSSFNMYSQNTGGNPAKITDYINKPKIYTKQQLRKSWNQNSQQNNPLLAESGSVTVNLGKKYDNNNFIELLNSNKAKDESSSKIQLKNKETKWSNNAQEIQIPLIEGLKIDDDKIKRFVFKVNREEKAQKDKKQVQSKNEVIYKQKNIENNLNLQNNKVKNTINKSIEILQSVKNIDFAQLKQRKFAKKQTSILKQFTIGPLLGKGKFGQVFLGRHSSTGFIVALKKIMKAKLLQYKLIDQFIKQIRLHNSLDHPKIVKFYGFLQEKDHFYLILEYMNGGTLFEYLNVVGTVTIKQAVQFLKDVIEALVYMHERSIAHRDLKPQNIVINTEGVAKLCDFGWAAVIQTARRTYCGTLDYVSPEVLERKDYNQSVDVWSIGILTYEMLMGKAPFEHKDRSVVRQKIINADSLQLEYTENIPQQARQFIKWLIQCDPTKRPKISELTSHKMFFVFGNVKTNKRSL